MRLTSLSVTDAEVTRFRTFGFLHLRGVQNDVVAAVADAFEDVFENFPQVGRQGRAGVARIAERSAVLQKVLLADDRCPRVARRLLGTDVVYVGGDGVRYNGATYWHRDGNHRALRLLKIVQYLEPLDGDTGALRIIPGTHRRGGSWDSFAAEMENPLRRLGMRPAEVPAFTVDSSPGDLIVFDPHSYHASFGGADKRRQITTTYAAVPQSAEARQELTSYLLADRSLL
ncbi:phytanoyl-CoA dioxygenase family protein [Streptomyces sp. NBC_00091]|uniref:phytanoyl-CoA dioxygenase family protein n=1 Tax=Streptomyces sp. NBC_00091 TaxID=2975648 RepID=UPI002255AADD|nr:phytanoyl-CoA dioxygenase family protein [Streptomyces sp. NBC_00091]MCX5380153.1 phytanoyl-CoA dioxygenase family protein [Streptomyces sp. NBC_00091]